MPTPVLGISGAVQQPKIRFSEDVEVPATQWESGAEFSLLSRASGIISTESEFESVVEVPSNDPAGS